MPITAYIKKENYKVMEDFRDDSLNTEKTKEIEADKETKTDGHRKAKNDDDEIDLIDLFAVVWHRKVMVILVTVIAAVFIVTLSIISLLLPQDKSFLPNVYTPKASLLISDNSSGGLSSLLSSSSSLSSLASLAGVNLSGGGDYKSLAIYLAGSDSLLDAVVDKFGLMEKYKKDKFARTAARKEVEKSLKAEVDDKSGVLVISYTNKDPALARDIVNFVVNYLDDRFSSLGLDNKKQKKINLEKSIANTYQEIENLQLNARNIVQSVGQRTVNSPAVGLETSRLQLELKAQQEIYVQLKAQYEIVKIDMESETPIFQVLERPEVPELKSGPSRGLLCIIVTFAAFFLSVLAAFVLNAIDNIKKDPEAMAKLRGGEK